MPNWDDPLSEREARSRRRRGSGDLVMARPPTIGAGLNELDNLLSQLDANQAEQTPEQQQVRGALGAGIMTILTAALAVFIGIVGMRPTTCEDTCAAAARRHHPLHHHQRRRCPRRHRPHNRPPRCRPRCRPGSNVDFQYRVPTKL